MGRYIGFSLEPEGESLVVFRAGGLDYTYGRYLEEHLPTFSFDERTKEITTDYIRHYFLEDLEEELQLTLSNILLDFTKKDFDNTLMLDNFDTYKSLCQIKGMIATLLEIAEANNNKLYVTYG